MSGPALLVTLLCLLAQIGAQQPCAACEGDACTIMDNIKVNKLCAEELCVGGDPVLVGDGDACTTDDILANGTVVHAPVKDCCRAGFDTDCAQWAPDVCHLSSCVAEDGASHGICVHEKLRDCCGCVADCTPRPCHEVQCVPTDDSEPLFAKRRADDKHFTLIHKTDQVVNAPGECRYTELPASANCCQASTDCVDGGPNTVGVCDGANTCVYINSLQFECTTDAQCQANTVETERCRSCGKRCADNMCVRGFCECVSDGGVDRDQDGTLCVDDCDDTNPLVNSTIFCTVLNRTDVNADNDAFVKCGVKVEELCANTCPPDRVKVNETQLDEAFDHKHQKERYVRYDCDCCDLNANDTAPDEFVFCAKDANDNGVFGPVLPEDIPPSLDDSVVLTPPGCYDKVCVPQARASRKPRKPKHRKHDDEDEDTDEETEEQTEDTPVLSEDEIRDQQCKDAFQSDDFVFVPPELRDPEATCDQCEDVPGADPDQTLADIDCPATTTVGKNKTISACSVTEENGGTTLADCCAELLQLPEDAENLPEQVKRWRKCCESFDGTFPANPDGTECDDVTSADFPLEVDVCKCEEHPTPCKHVAHCVPDRDGDGYYDCDKPKTVCVDKLPRGCSEEWTAEKKESAICRAELGDKWTGLDEALHEGTVENQGSGTFCDCDDSKPEAHGKIACFRDQDNDGYPLCEHESFHPVCQQFCACDCPKGWLDVDHSVLPTNTSNCSIDKRKRSNVASLSELNKVLGGGGGRGGGHSGHGGPGHGHGGPGYTHPPAPAPDHEDTEKSDTDWWDDTDEKSSESDTKTSSHSDHKPKLPRHDQECEFLSCAYCDCCDIDKLVYPDTGILPVWSSPDENKCGNFDYNCDRIETVTVACPGSEEADIKNDPRNIYATYTAPGSTDPAEGIFVATSNPTTDPVGECDLVGDDCVHTGGWTLEKVFDRKRSAGHELPDGCEKEVVFVSTAGTVLALEKPVTNINDLSNARPVRPGDCGDWVQECHSPDADTCSPDCEICLRNAF